MPAVPFLAALQVAALAASVAVPSSAQSEQLTISPASPTDLDPITITLSGEWPDSCTPELISVAIDNSFLDLEASVQLPGDVCAEVVTPYETSIQVGFLPPGSYDVRVLAIVNFPPPTVIARSQLEVSASADRGLEAIEISPAEPSTQDRVTVVAQGTWPDGCIPRLDGVEVEDRTIRLFAIAEGQGCILAVSDYTLITTVGPLAEGEWQIEVLVADRRAGDSEAPFELAGRRTFAVDTESTETLIVGGRFAISVTWTNGSDRSGVGVPLRGALPDQGNSGSGAFFFFAPENTELLVKVLEACAVNDRYWVFISAATDLGFEVTVEDLTAGGATRTYTNEPGEPARAVTDVEAFAICDEP
ncbi:MAG TPA: hypothetical protein VMT85_10735 [Thermoanaerobaculia bacterium]|nr:hypothetical protein [Thermoanaerobaculia bacterium]